MASDFKAFDKTYPTTASGTRQVNLDKVRQNLMALISCLVMGSPVPGWAYTNSVTRAEGTPGTADQPVRVYFTYGTGGGAIWVKCVLTWNGGTGNLDKVAFYWSDDNEGTYDNLDDGSGNYVLTISYDASSNVTQATWGNVP